MKQKKPPIIGPVRINPYLCSPYLKGQIGFDSGSEWYVSTQCAWRWAL